MTSIRIYPHFRDFYVTAIRKISTNRINYVSANSATSITARYGQFVVLAATRDSYGAALFHINTCAVAAGP